MRTARREFGERLRGERERRGLILRTIADSTKIPFPLLAGLERGDIEHWPAGLFGRAHLRAYAEAVGLPSEQLVVEFLRLSSDTSNDTTPARVPARLTPDSGARLTLAEDRHWTTGSTGIRVLAWALDLCAIFAAAGGIARFFDADFPLVCALVGLTYYGLSTLALGRSVTLWWVGKRALQRTRGTVTLRTRAMSLVPRERVPRSGAA
jgi:transcriptional regulator with XRE-family HTH domain